MMKKHLLLLTCTFIAGSLSWAQTSIFTGASGTDFLYSNSDNWSAGLPGSASGFAQFNATARLDISPTVRQIRSGGTGGINDDGGTITLTGVGFPVSILQTGGTGGVFTVNCKVILNSAEASETFQVNGTDGTLTFGPDSDVTLNTVAALNATGTRIINMNGILRGSSDLRINGNTNVVFGSTSDHSNFASAMVFFGANANVVVNTADDGVFVPVGRKVQVNGNNNTLELNGANIYNGAISLSGTNAFRLAVNKNQIAMNNITLVNGILTLALGEDVARLEFNDHSETNDVDWGTGSLVVENFKNGVVRFGSSSSGLSPARLSQVDIGGGSVYVNNGGYLIATETSEWTGNWNSTPGASDDAVIAADYTAGNLEVNDLTILAGSTVTIASGETLKINGELINNGTLNILTGGSLVTMDNILGQATIARTTTFPSSEGRYSVVGSPVQESTTDLLGSLVYAYDATIPFGSERFSQVTTTEMMGVGDGYFSAFTGDVSFTGVPNTGNVDVSLVYDEINDGGAGNAGFNLVSNPYPCAISWSSFTDPANNPDIGSTIYLWDDGGSEMSRRTNADYITANSIGTAGAGSGRADDWNGHIGAAQGFFVKATTAGTLNFTDAMKVSGNNLDANYFRTGSEIVGKLKVELRSRDGENRFTSLVGFAEDATPGIDHKYDAVRLGGENSFSIYSMLEDESMTIQGLPILSEEFTLPLGFTIEETGEYTMIFDELSTLEDLSVTLVDKLSGQQINLHETASYTFASETIGPNVDRFDLVFSPDQILSFEELRGAEIFTTLSGIEIVTGQESTTLKGEVLFSDLQGKQLLKRSLKEGIIKQKIPYAFERGMIYIIRIQLNGSSSSRKIMFN